MFSKNQTEVKENLNTFWLLMASFDIYCALVNIY